MLGGNSFFYVIPLLMIFFVLAVAVVLLRKLPGQLRARERALTAPGRVLEVEPRWASSTDGPDRKYYAVRCSYAVGDRTLSGWSDERHNTRDWAEGDDVTLFYDPQRPDVFTLKPPPGPTAVLIFAAVFLAFGAGIVAFALFFIHGVSSQL